MKIRNPKLIRWTSRLAAFLIRTWVGSVRFEQRCLGPIVDPRRPDRLGRYIYAFWHENLLLPAHHYARPDIYVLISQHADGQIVTEVAERFGFRTVRGSATRGGVEAVRKMLKMSHHAHLAVTPDGPRGPRRQLQSGLIYLAARTGLPIVPVGIGYDRPWRAKSWDRLAVPRPFCRGRSVLGEPLFVPPGTDRTQLERHRFRVQNCLDEVTALAESWAETGEWPAVSSQGSGVRSLKSDLGKELWRAAG